MKKFPWFREIALLTVLVSVVFFSWINYHSGKSNSSSSKDIVVNATNDTMNKPSLEIYDKSTKIDGDYIYITGRIKNVGSEPIQYWKVTVEFLNNSGDILDTDYTNDTEIVKPGAMKEFQIMHKYSNEYEKTRVYVSEYR